MVPPPPPLVLAGEAVDPARVLGFHERYDAWTGRAWLDVVGTGVTVAMTDGYADQRRDLRARFPDRPFTSDWADGRFPACPGGWPVDAVSAALGAVGTVAIGAVAWVGGPWIGALVAPFAYLPVLRARHRVSVRREGLLVGSPLATALPWRAVRSMRVDADGRVFVAWEGGGEVASVPPALIPALRARVWRVGGLSVDGDVDPIDWRYLRWSVAADGVRVGLVAALALAMPGFASPWRAATGALLGLAGLLAMTAALRARATGWGAGAVFGLTAAYAVLLAGIALSIGAW